jgi:RNA polymerase sigma-54 factor
MLQEARWLLRNIEQRLDTIQRVATAIVNRQRVFFSHGDAAMRPMVLRDIASEVGLHESTVCRVTNGKYMATPRGLFEFKYFFSRQLPARGGSCSALAIRALIKELIAAENPEQPLSDVQLAHLLNAQGFGLVRRTVTKYRSQMHVPSVELRRVSHR